MAPVDALPSRLPSRHQPGRERLIAYDGSVCVLSLVRSEAVAEVLANVAPTWPTSPLASAGDRPVIEVVADGGGRFSVTAPWFDEQAVGLTAASAACAVLADLSRGWLEAHPQALCLHAAAFASAGRLVVLVGDSHAGKSTLATRLSSGEVQLICDDVLPIVGGQGIALGVAPRVRLPLPPHSSRSFMRFVAAHLAASDERYGYVLPSALAPHGLQAPIGATVIMDRRREGPAGLVPASPGEALHHLVRRNLVRTAAATDLLDGVAELLAGVTAVRLFYSDLDEAADLLRQTFSQWPPRATSWIGHDRDAGERIAPARRSGSADKPHPADAGTHFQARPDIGIRRFDDRMFLTSATEDGVYELNAIGAAVWRLLAAPISAAEAAARLHEAFPGTPLPAIEDDVRSLFAGLAAEELIEPRNAFAFDD